VAVQREAGDAALGQGAQSPAHPVFLRIRVVIAHPRLEQVAEDVERLGGRGLGSEKAEELLGGLGRAGIQMHVRDEQARHVRYFGERIVVSGRGGGAGVSSAGLRVTPAATISTFSMTTGFKGASDLKGPTAPVGVSPMCSMTSIPCTMRLK